jgi:hypothetical protein
MNDTANTQPLPRPSWSGAAAAVGLRRVDWVRVFVADGQTVAEMAGVAHRYPRRFRVSLAGAARLAEAGVPLRIEHPGASCEPDTAGEGR